MAALVIVPTVLMVLIDGGKTRSRRRKGGWQGTRMCREANHAGIRWHRFMTLILTAYLLMMGVGSIFCVESLLLPSRPQISFHGVVVLALANSNRNHSAMTSSKTHFDLQSSTATKQHRGPKTATRTFPPPPLSPTTTLVKLTKTSTALLTSTASRNGLRTPSHKQTRTVSSTLTAAAPATVTAFGTQTPPRPATATLGMTRSLLVSRTISVSGQTASRTLLKTETVLQTRSLSLSTSAGPSPSHSRAITRTQTAAVCSKQDFVHALRVWPFFWFPPAHPNGDRQQGIKSIYPIEISLTESAVRDGSAVNPFSDNYWRRLREAHWSKDDVRWTSTGPMHGYWEFITPPPPPTTRRPAPVRATRLGEESAVSSQSKNLMKAQQFNDSDVVDAAPSSSSSSSFLSPREELRAYLKRGGINSHPSSSSPFFSSPPSFVDGDEEKKEKEMAFGSVRRMLGSSSSSSSLSSPSPYYGYRSENDEPFNNSLYWILSPFPIVMGSEAGGGGGAIFPGDHIPLRGYFVHSHASNAAQPNNYGFEKVIDQRQMNSMADGEGDDDVGNVAAIMRRREELTPHALRINNKDKSQNGNSDGGSGGGDTYDPTSFSGRNFFPMIGIAVNWTHIALAMESIPRYSIGIDEFVEVHLDLRHIGYCGNGSPTFTTASKDKWGGDWRGMGGGGGPNGGAGTVFADHVTHMRGENYYHIATLHISPDPYPARDAAAEALFYAVAALTALANGGGGGGAQPIAAISMMRCSNSKFASTAKYRMLAPFAPIAEDNAESDARILGRHGAGGPLGALTGIGIFIGGVFALQVVAVIIVRLYAFIVPLTRAQKRALHVAGKEDAKATKDGGAAKGNGDADEAAGGASCLTPSTMAATTAEEDREKEGMRDNHHHQGTDAVALEPANAASSPTDVAMTGGGNGEDADKGQRHADGGTAEDTNNVGNRRVLNVAVMFKSKPHHGDVDGDSTTDALTSTSEEEYNLQKLRTKPSIGGFRRRGVSTLAGGGEMGGEKLFRRRRSSQPAAPTDSIFGQTLTGSRAQKDTECEDAADVSTAAATTASSGLFSLKNTTRHWNAEETSLVASPVQSAAMVKRLAAFAGPTPPNRGEAEDTVDHEGEGVPDLQTSSSAETSNSEDDNAGRGEVANAEEERTKHKASARRRHHRRRRAAASPSATQQKRSATLPSNSPNPPLPLLLFNCHNTTDDDSDVVDINRWEVKQQRKEMARMGLDPSLLSSTTNEGTSNDSKEVNHHRSSRYGDSISGGGGVGGEGGGALIVPLMEGQENVEGAGGGGGTDEKIENSNADATAKKKDGEEEQDDAHDDDTITADALRNNALLLSQIAEARAKAAERKRRLIEKRTNQLLTGCSRSPFVNQDIQTATIREDLEPIPFDVYQHSMIKTFYINTWVGACAACYFPSITFLVIDASLLGLVFIAIQLLQGPGEAFESSSSASASVASLSSSSTSSKIFGVNGEGLNSDASRGYEQMAGTVTILCCLAYVLLCFVLLPAYCIQRAYLVAKYPKTISRVANDEPLTDDDEEEMREIEQRAVRKLAMAAKAEKERRAKEGRKDEGEATGGADTQSRGERKEKKKERSKEDKKTKKKEEKEESFASLEALAGLTEEEKEALKRKRRRERQAKKMEKERRERNEKEAEGNHAAGDSGQTAVLSGGVSSAGGDDSNEAPLLLGGGSHGGDVAMAKSSLPLPLATRCPAWLKWLFFPKGIVMSVETVRMFGPLVAYSRHHPLWSTMPLWSPLTLSLLGSFPIRKLESLGGAVAGCIFIYVLMAILHLFFAFIILVLGPFRYRIVTLCSALNFVATAVLLFIASASIGSEDGDFTDAMVFGAIILAFIQVAFTVVKLLSLLLCSLVFFRDIMHSSMLSLEWIYFAPYADVRERAKKIPKKAIEAVKMVSESLSELANDIAGLCADGGEYSHPPLRNIVFPDDDHPQGGDDTAPTAALSDGESHADDADEGGTNAAAPVDGRNEKNNKNFSADIADASQQSHTADDEKDDEDDKLARIEKKRRRFLSLLSSAFNEGGDIENAMAEEEMSEINSQQSTRQEEKQRRREQRRLKEQQLNNSQQGQRQPSSPSSPFLLMPFLEADPAVATNVVALALVQNSASAPSPSSTISHSRRPVNIDDDALLAPSPQHQMINTLADAGKVSTAAEDEKRIDDDEDVLLGVPKRKQRLDPTTEGVNGSVGEAGGVETTIVVSAGDAPAAAADADEGDEDFLLGPPPTCQSHCNSKVEGESITANNNNDNADNSMIHSNNDSLFGASFVPNNSILNRHGSFGTMLGSGGGGGGDGSKKRERRPGRAVSIMIEGEGFVSPRHERKQKKAAAAAGEESAKVMRVGDVDGDYSDYSEGDGHLGAHHYTVEKQLEIPSANLPPPAMIQHHGGGDVKALHEKEERGGKECNVEWGSEDSLLGPKRPASVPSPFSTVTAVADSSSSETTAKSPTSIASLIPEVVAPPARNFPSQDSLNHHNLSTGNEKVLLFSSKEEAAAFANLDGGERFALPSPSTSKRASIVKKEPIPSNSPSLLLSSSSSSHHHRPAPINTFSSISSVLADQNVKEALKRRGEKAKEKKEGSSEATATEIVLSASSSSSMTDADVYDENNEAHRTLRHHHHPHHQQHSEGDNSDEDDEDEDEGGDDEDSRASASGDDHNSLQAAASYHLLNSVDMSANLDASMVATIPTNSMWRDPLLTTRRRGKGRGRRKAGGTEAKECEKGRNNGKESD